MKFNKIPHKFSGCVLGASIALCYIHPQFPAVVMALGAMAMHACLVLLSAPETKNSELESLKAKMEQTSSEVKKISLLLGRK